MVITMLLVLSVYDVSGTSRCLFSDKYKTHEYSVGRAYSCWMLNWWCITWPVGFKRLNCVSSTQHVQCWSYKSISLNWYLLWNSSSFKSNNLSVPTFLHHSNQGHQLHGSEAVKKLSWYLTAKLWSYPCSECTETFLVEFVPPPPTCHSYLLVLNLAWDKNM